MTPSRVGRSTRRYLTAILGFRGMSVLLGSVALAPAAHLALPHISLVSSTPAKDSHIMTAPKEIRLTFSGPIHVAKASVEMVSADSKSVALDSLRAVVDSAHVAVAKIPAPLPGGTYTVRWKAVAADGAAGSGSFSFMYMAPSGK